MVQQSDTGRSSRGVPLHPDALDSAAHPAAPAAASLLLYQLLFRYAPRRDPPHRCCRFLPYQRHEPTLFWGSFLVQALL